MDTQTVMTNGKIKSVGEYLQVPAGVINGSPSRKIGRFILLLNRMETNHWLTPFAERTFPRDIIVPIKKRKPS